MMHHNDNASIRYISMFSGIEAATLAFRPLGWKAVAFAEFEKFPSRVLAHHYPDTPNVGDVTKHDWSQYRGQVDIVVGGPPCQAFSVAGLRNSLEDDRGNLSLVYMRALHAIKPRNAIVENVPGWLNTHDNAFGCFLAGLVGADAPLESGLQRGRWPVAGMVDGPLARAAWRVQDAQFHGLAQRRRRVFVVVDFGNGADPAAVLFEPVGVLGNSPPRREAQKDVAAAVTASTGGISGKDDIDGRVTAVLRGISDYGDGLPALRAKGGDCAGGSEAFVFAPEIARCDATREGNSQDYETTTMVAQCITGDVTHTLRAEGFDASEDGTGRGNPIVAFNPRATDVPVTGEITGALDASFPGPAICFSAKDYGGDAMPDLAPTLRAGGHSGSPANAGVMPAVAFGWQNSSSQGASVSEHVSPTLDKSKTPAVLTSAVRRLTPRECERLQGFPDDYTLLPGYDADGPRYKALGNSFAVPVMRWIGERIALHMPAANDNRKIMETAA